MLKELHNFPGNLSNSVHFPIRQSAFGKLLSQVSLFASEFLEILSEQAQAPLVQVAFEYVSAESGCISHK